MFNKICMAYLAKPSDTIENPTRDDVKKAIIEIKDNFEEHAAFWYGSDEEEIVVEVHGDLKGFLILDAGSTNFKFQFDDWLQVEETFNDLIDGRWDLVKSKFNASS
jgi:3-deoxy-D-arabino-heptulosonate 7-phosphate (DAHP) synthase